jgi:hypothetical protein
MAQRYAPETPVPDWRERLVLFAFREPEIDMVVTGTERQTEVIRWREIRTLGLSPGIQRFCGSYTLGRSQFAPLYCSLCTPWHRISVAGFSREGSRPSDVDMVTPVG